MLPEGLFCDTCQNIFGSTIEQQALATYPLSMYRTFLSIPTKKGKAPWFPYWEGKLEAGGMPGIFAYTPSEIFKEPILSGNKTMTIIPSVVNKPEMLLRTLIKIGLEVVAATANDFSEVFEQKFDAARRYALTGKKDYPWFFIQIEDVQALNDFIQNPKYDSLVKNVGAYIETQVNGGVFLDLKLLYLQFIVPLRANTILEQEARKLFKEPRERVIEV